MMVHKCMYLCLFELDFDELLVYFDGCHFLGKCYGTNPQSPSLWVFFFQNSVEACAA